MKYRSALIIPNVFQKLVLGNAKALAVKIYQRGLYCINTAPL